MKPQLAAVRIEVPEIRVDEAQPHVLILIRLTNGTDGPVRVPRSIIQPDPFHVALEHAWKGKVVPRGGSHVFSGGADPNQTSTLAPTDSRDLEWDLLDDFDLPHAGTYYLRMDLDMQDYIRNLVGRDPMARGIPYRATSERYSFAISTPLQRLSAFEAEAVAILKRRHPIRTAWRRIFARTSHALRSSPDIGH